MGQRLDMQERMSVMSKLDKVQKYVEKGKEAGLLKLIHDKDKSVRLAAIEGMGKIGRDDSFNNLVTMLSDDDADIRAASADALGVLKNSHADAHLRYRLGIEKDAKVVEAIKKAVASLPRD